MIIVAILGCHAKLSRVYTSAVGGIAMITDRAMEMGITGIMRITGITTTTITTTTTTTEETLEEEKIDAGEARKDATEIGIKEDDRAEPVEEGVKNMSASILYKVFIALLNSFIPQCAAHSKL